MEKRPPLRVLGSHEIRLRLGSISKQRTYHITGRRDFPEPAVVLAQGSIWYTEDVEEWIARNRPWLQEGAEDSEPATNTHQPGKDKATDKTN